MVVLVTISGGEPLDFAIDLIELIKMIKPGLTSVIFTGYTIKEIFKDVNKVELVKSVDMVLAGRYNNKFEHPYLGKKLLNITGRVDSGYFLPRTSIEYSINLNKVTKTGIFKI
jgi:organic radical activating enzyme